MKPLPGTPSAECRDFNLLATSNNKRLGTRHATPPSVGHALSGYSMVFYTWLATSLFSGLQYICNFKKLSAKWRKFWVLYAPLHYFHSIFRILVQLQREKIKISAEMISCPPENYCLEHERRHTVMWARQAWTKYCFNTFFTESYDDKFRAQHRLIETYPSR